MKTMKNEENGIRHVLCHIKKIKSDILTYHVTFFGLRHIVLCD